ncbi:MAG: MBL fold metallo-hydrolase [Polyangiaceae bacterium]|jgi:L-ascorbate metabolism protein UlaG (beta-lactamase superfamily)|nr:MBL fold metallo-hydrolase [Polyangiaceae bacterium]MBK8941436.1 MBL fold metallo-hydrolase [Polyangiaceae bacterium]
MYTNLDGSRNDKTLVDVLKWKLDLSDEKRPPRDPSRDTPAPRIANDGALLRRADRPALTWIGHATYLIQLGGRSILVDPMFSERLFALRRLVDPGLAVEALPKIDAVLVTHNHRDHMDAPSLRRLGPRTRFIVPKGLAAWFRREHLDDVVELGWWEHHDLAGARITFVPSHHWSQRGPFDRNTSLWGGFVVEDGTHRVYHSGDTAYFEGFRDIGRRLGPIDAAMLPIGAYEPRWFMKAQHMNPDDAVRAFIDLGARRFAAMHWGTFRLTDEQLSDPPLHTRERWSAERLDEARLAIPAIGETLLLE